MAPFQLAGLALIGWGLWMAPGAAWRALSSGNDGGSVVACEARFKSTLKDPRSYQYISSWHTEDSVTVEFRAKNSFGGYSVESRTCKK